MKLLLDENLPKRLKSGFSGHEVFTVNEMGWSGKTNGALLQLMLEQNFDALITFDKNLQHQQNFRKYSLMVVVLNAASNTLSNLLPLCTQVLAVLKKPAVPGPVVISEKS